MTTQDTERRRVLIVAGEGSERPLRELFAHDMFDGWETLEADSFSRARFVLQHDPCDLLLVNDDLLENAGGQGLAWLTWHRETPVVLVAGPSSETMQRAYELGVNMCLARDMVLANPALLATAMVQAIRAGSMRQDYKRTKERLTEARQHVDRLVNLIWRTSPRQAESQWFSQRYMLERLHEELSRVERHQVPLTVAIGELQTAAEDKPEEAATEAPALPEWAMNMIAKGKRRCDVVGQYGMAGFMLLMVHTPIKGGVNCCRRLQKYLEHPEEPPPGPHSNMHAFFGVSSTVTGKMSSVALLRAAEQNLEAARTDARERIVVD